MAISRKLTALSLACLFLFTGCATPIPPEVIANADYGPRPPKNYQALIKADFSKVLIDPTSPIYEFDKPVKGYTAKNDMFNTFQMFGWRVCGTVNSKNRLGAYVGSVPFFVLFKNGRLAEKVMGQVTDNEYGINLLNSSIQQACSGGSGG